MKRFLSMILTLVLIISVLAVPASASSSKSLAEVAKGTPGKSKSDLGLPSGDWCCYFIGYCINNSIVHSWAEEKISIADSKNPMTLINWTCAKKNIGTYYSFSSTHYNRLINKYKNLSIVSTSINDFTPIAGDILIVDWKGREDREHYFSHAGIVTDYNTSSKTVTFVDGNSDAGKRVYVREGKWSPNNSVYNDIIGYIRLDQQNVSITPPPTDTEKTTLSITPTAYPTGTLKQGSRYSLKGTVTSNYNITSVKGEIIDSNGNIVFSYTQRPNSKSFSILNSRLDANMKFNELFPGKYYLRYTAADCSEQKEGKQTWESAVFSITGEEGPESTLKIVSDDYPTGTITEGSRYSLRGSVTSNFKITSVRGEIIDSNGTVIYSYTQRPNATSFSFLNSKLDANMKFNLLSPGEYYLKYTAEDESGKTVDWRSGTFQVQGEQAELRVTISFDPKGGSVDRRTKTVLAGEVAGLLPVPVRDGYEFIRWAAEDGLVVESDTVIIQDMTVYAQWRPQPVEEEPDVEVPEPEPKPIGDWSEWSDTPVSASETRQVETREVKVSDAYTEYRYGRYIDATGKHNCWCATYLGGLFKGPVSEQYSSWSGTRYSASGTGWSCGNCRGNHRGVDHTGSDGRDWWAEYRLPNGHYYWEESRTVPAEYKTQYRYRDWIYD